MTEPLWSAAHLEIAATIIGMILIPLGSGILWLRRGQRDAAKSQGQLELKVDTMWAWFTNHGSNITGYKKENK